MVLSWTVTAGAALPEEGLKQLYRTLLVQARLLAHTLDDRVLYATHRYLARSILQPVLNHHNNPPAPSTDPDADFGKDLSRSPIQRRLYRARGQRRNLADANLGWEHAVFKALSLAYGRTGRLSRDLMTDMASPEFTASPVVAAILTSQNSMDGTPLKNAAAFTSRPPPPYLPALDDPLVVYYGRGVSERRVQNATKRFRSAYRGKASGKLPLDVVFAGETVGEGDPGSIFAHLEAKARPPSECIATVHRQEAPPAPGYIGSAKVQALSYSSGIEQSEHRPRHMREQGWTSHPSDYSCERRRRRIYGRLLHIAPILVLPACDTPHFSTLVGPSSAKDPLGIRAKLKAACAYTTEHTIGAGKIKVLRSRYAVGPRAKAGESAPPQLSRSAENSEWADPAAWLDASEVEYLQRNKVL